MNAIFRTALAAAFGALILTGCQGGADVDADAQQVWPLPAGAGSAQPDLSLGADGRIRLSWLQQQPGQRSRLQYAEFDGDGNWGPARTVAVGSRLLANWADIPHVLATSDGAVWAQWLQKVDAVAAASDADSGHASADHSNHPGHGGGYHVILATSRDGGVNWSQPARVHADDSPAEHGFAALWPAPGGRLGIAWLDGGAQHADPAAGMQLRATELQPGLTAGSEDAEQLIDARSCECCPVAVAVTAQGPLLAWRGRDENEIRDIHVSRQQDGQWSTPRLLHADGWRIEGCPVNGPALAAEGARVLAAWFTGADDRPRVQLAISDDAGAAFGTPLELDAGNAVLGRIAVALDAQQAWALWLRQDDGSQNLWLARFSPDLGRELERTRLAELASDGRSSGLPRLVVRNGTAFVAWTDMVDGASQVRGIRYRPQDADS